MNEPTIETTPKALKIIGKIFEILLISICVGIVGWLCLRAVWQKGPSKLRNFITTDLTDTNEEVYHINEYNSNELEKPIHISYVYKTDSSLQFMLCFNKYSNESVNPEDFTFVLKGDDGSEYKTSYKLDKKTVMYTHTKVCFYNLSFEGVEEYEVEIYHGGKLFDTCTVYKNDGFQEIKSLKNSEKKITEMIKCEAK